MKAKIKINDLVRDIYIFAIIKAKDYGTKIVFYNEDSNNLEFFNFYSIVNNKITQKVFIVEAKPKNFVENNNISGYDWFINENFIKLIESGSYNEGFINKCKYLQENIKIEESFYVKTKQDIDNLYALTRFHDAYIEKMIIENNVTNICFNTTWGVKVYFTLKDGVMTNLDKNDRGYIVYNSTMFIESGLIFWVDNENVKSKNEIKSEDKYFCAENVTYKIEIC